MLVVSIWVTLQAISIRTFPPKTFQNFRKNTEQLVVFMIKINGLQPCPISGRFIAEIDFGRKISMDRLYFILRDKTSDIRYSQELGIAKFDFENKRFRVCSKGEVKISRIKDEKEAKIMIKILEKIIKKAFI